MRARWRRVGLGSSTPTELQAALTQLASPPPPPPAFTFDDIFDRCSPVLSLPAQPTSRAVPDRAAWAVACRSLRPKYLSGQWVVGDSGAGWLSGELDGEPYYYEIVSARSPCHAGDG